MQDFKNLFQTLPSNFLPLGSEVSEPFIIPNVTPTSSPVLQPIQEIGNIEESNGNVSIVDLN